MKKYKFFYDSTLADMVDDSNLPTETMIQLNVKRKDMEFSILLTDDEAMVLLKDIAKNLDPKKVYKAIGNIVVKG